MKMDQEIAALPAGHLKLPALARRAAAKFKTVGKLRAALETRGDEAPRWTPMARGQIEAVLQHLTSATETTGLKGWDRFRRSRQGFGNAESLRSLYFMSPALDRLKETCSRQFVPALHLSVRAINALEAIGVERIGELVRRARHGVDEFASAGVLTVMEIEEALDALSHALRRDGSIDWVDYAQAGGIKVLPAKVTRASADGGFVKVFIEAMRGAVQIQYGAADALVLRRRLLALPGRELTLRALGSQFGLTHERVRQTEEMMIKMLRRAIWLDDFRGSLFRFRIEFLQPLRSMVRALQRERRRAFSLPEWNAFLTDKNCRFQLRPAILEAVAGEDTNSPGGGRGFLFVSQLDLLVKRFLGVRLADLGASERLLLKLLGIRAMKFRRRGSDPLLLLPLYPDGAEPGKLETSELHSPLPGSLPAVERVISRTARKAVPT
jgi:hypothetical protein